MNKADLEKMTHKEFIAAGIKLAPRKVLQLAFFNMACTVLGAFKKDREAQGKPPLSLEEQEATLRELIMIELSAATDAAKAQEKKEEPKAVNYGECPECGHTLSDRDIRHLGERRPMQDGDTAICPKCVAFLTRDQGKLRLLTADEIVELPPEMRATMIEVRKVFNERKAKAN